MIKTDIDAGAVLAAGEAGRMSGAGPQRTQRQAFEPDVVEISDECKKRLVMSNLKSALSATDGPGGRYRR